MRDFKNGEIRVLYIQLNGVFHPIGCTQSDSFSESAQVVPTTTRDNSNGWATQRISGQSFTLSFEGLIEFSNDPNMISYKDLTSIKRARNVFNWKLVTNDSIETTDFGQGQLTELSTAAAIDSFISFTGSIIGYGEPNNLYDFILKDYTDRVYSNDGWITSDDCLESYFNMLLLNGGPYEQLVTGFIGGGGIKAGKVFSTKPDDGTGYFEFVRASEGTRTNNNGLIVTDNVNIPRADYKEGRTCPAIMVQPLSQNLIPWSEDFSNSFWENIAGFVDSNQVVAPNGDLADKFREGTTTGYRELRASNVSIGVGTAVFSVFAKYIGNNRQIRLFQVNDDYTTNSSVFFDIENGSVLDFGGDSLISQGIEDYRDGWYRCYMIFSNNSTLNDACSIRITDGLIPTYQGDGVSGVYLWGAQLETTSAATSYMSTSGGVTTRQAETLSQTPVETNVYSPKGSFVLTLAALGTVNEDRLISVNGGSTDNEILLRYRNKAIGFRVTVDGIVQAVASTQQLDQTPFRNIGIQWGDGVCEFWVDGELISSQTMADDFEQGSMNQIIVNKGLLGTFYGWIEALNIYDDNTLDLELMTTYTTFVEMANNFKYTVQ